jgi:hypothetical protein
MNPWRITNKRQGGSVLITPPIRALFFTMKLSKICEIYIISLCWGIGVFLVCLTVYENAGMSENHRYMMDYEYQEKKNEIYYSSKI